MPDEPVPTLGKKTYEVVGRNAVEGVATGGTLTLDLTQEQHDYYVNGGFLKVAKTTGKEE